MLRVDELDGTSANYCQKHNHINYIVNILEQKVINDSVVLLICDERSRDDALAHMHSHTPTQPYETKQKVFPHDWSVDILSEFGLAAKHFFIVLHIMFVHTVYS